MKITDAYINGFGHFHDQSVSDIGPGMVLFQGPNEAGKSTLLGFIRSLFFGFPRVNAKDAQYTPLAGGRHGGQIEFISEDGTPYTLSRKPGSRGGHIELTGPDGSTHDKGALSRLLGGITYEAFRNIYAFGLSELESFESLKGESVAGAIYGAGLGNAMMALPAAKKKIRDQLDTLFKPGGSKPTLNRIVAELDQVDRSLKETQGQTARYDALWDALGQVEKQISEVQNDLKALRRNRHRYGAMVRLWPEWVTLQESEGRLAQTAKVPAGFPREGLDRLHRLVDMRQRLGDAAAEIEDREEKLRSQLSTLTVDQSLLDQATNIASLLEKRSGYSHNIQQRTVLQQKISTEAAEIQQVLDTLGSGWTEERLCVVDRSLFTREAIRKHRSHGDMLQKDLMAAEKLFADKEGILDRANRELAQAEKTLVALGKPPADRDPSLLLQVKQGRDRFADAVFDVERTEASWRQAKQALDQSLREAEEQRGFEFLGRVVQSKWLLPLLAWGGAVATGLTGYFQEGWERPAIAGGGAMLVLVAAWGYQRYRIRIDQYQEEEIRSRKEKAEELHHQLSRLNATLTSYGALAAQALELSTEEKFSGQALLTEVDRLIALLPEEDRRREAYLRARELVDRKREERNAGLKDLKGAGVRQETIRDQVQQGDEAWQAWLSDQGLPKTLSPETAMEALDGIQRATAAIFRRDQLTEELNHLEDGIKAYRDAFKETLGVLEQPVPSEALWSQVVDEQVIRLEKAKGDEREKKTLEKQAEALAWERSEIDRKITSNNETIHALVTEAGMVDEKEFEQTAKTLLLRENLTDAIHQCRNNIHRILGEADSDALRKELSALSLTDAKMREEEAAGSIQTLDGELTTLLSKRAELQQELDSLAASDDVFLLRTREAELMTALEDNAHEWARWALADFLVDKVTASFEKKHQPLIVRDAGDLFSRMTGGRYSGLLAPIGENTILAVTDKGEQIPPQALSRGTAEQLYLAVRFGYIRHRAKTGEPLPVVMDDILVNFDPVRARHAAEAIHALAVSHQVLYFTCHPETTALFKDIDPRVSLYGLTAGAIHKEASLG